MNDVRKNSFLVLRFNARNATNLNKVIVTPHLINKANILF